jgi:hypothetical protein
MWAKLTTTTRVTVSLFCDRSLSISLPKGDDMKLLVGKSDASYSPLTNSLYECQERLL